MRRMSVLMIIVVGLFVSIGCGKFNPTGPSEAAAADTTKGAPSTASTAILSLSPSQVTVNVGEEVTVDAVVDSVVDLYGIATTVLFDSTVLQFVRAEEGGFLNKQNQTAFMKAVGSDPNRLVIGLSSLGKVSGVSGSGTLFRVTFKAIGSGGSGQSAIEFVETTLYNSTNSGVSKEKISFPDFRFATPSLLVDDIVKRLLLRVHF